MQQAPVQAQPLDRYESEATESSTATSALPKSRAVRLDLKDHVIRAEGRKVPGTRPRTRLARFRILSRAHWPRGKYVLHHSMRQVGGFAIEALFTCTSKAASTTRPAWLAIPEGTAQTEAGSLHGTPTLLV